MCNNLISVPKILEFQHSFSKAKEESESQGICCNITKIAFGLKVRKEMSKKMELARDGGDKSHGSFINMVITCEQIQRSRTKVNDYDNLQPISGHTNDRYTRRDKTERFTEPSDIGQPETLNSCHLKVTSGRSPFAQHKSITTALEQQHFPFLIPPLSSQFGGTQQLRTR